MNREKPTFIQKFISIVSLVLLGFTGVAVLLDAVSNSMSILTPKVSCWTIISILITWLTSELFVLKNKPNWVSSNGRKARIIKLNKGIRLPIIGAILLLAIPIFKDFRKAKESIGISSFPISKSSNSLFSSDESFNILLLPFGTSQNCINEEVVCEREVYFRFKNRLSLDRSSDIDVALYNSRDSLRIYDYDEVWKIGQETNADLVVWGDYNNRCNSDSTKVRLNWLNIEWAVPFEQHLYNNEYVSLSDISLIEKGKITGNVEEIIYWALGAREIESQNMEKALFYFDQIKGKDHEDYAALFFFLGLTRLRVVLECGTDESLLLDAKKAIRLDKANVNSLS